jgi:hypothetical protein
MLGMYMHEMMIKGGFWILRFLPFCIFGLHLAATKSRYPFTDPFGLSWRQQQQFLLVSFFVARV